MTAEPVLFTPRIDCARYTCVSKKIITLYSMLITHALPIYYNNGTSFQE